MKPDSVTAYVLIAPNSLLQAAPRDYQHTSRSQGHLCSSSSITAAYSSVSQQTFTSVYYKLGRHTVCLSLFSATSAVLVVTSSKKAQVKYISCH